ncbi:RHS repeat domain-containing protein [Apibacter sp. HY039]|uniref:RHS repeat domain-containing protein n=1 Tax=Apibacter sp. HY039 TaxID=2501476 RepID=UPI0013E3D591|nr:RHS repeat-associated core domain-containing protein [Apibacter sp. HY039]
MKKHYYHFGLKYTGYNSQSGQPEYKYNGKEQQEEVRLNVYDYGARNYSPDTVRWFTKDPLAERHLNFSPYVYVINNLILFIDLYGMDIIIRGRLIVLELLQVNISTLMEMYITEMEMRL